MSFYEDFQIRYFVFEKDNELTCVKCHNSCAYSHYYKIANDGYDLSKCHVSYLKSSELNEFIELYDKIYHNHVDENGQKIFKNFAELIQLNEHDKVESDEFKLHVWFEYLFHCLKCNGLQFYF